MREVKSSVAIDETKLFIVPPDAVRPFGISLTPASGGTGTLTISVSPLADVKAGTGVFKLYFGAETGWTNGVAAVGARPAVITFPITAFKVLATTAACVVEARY